MKPLPTKHGFTLIEILVVMTIIAVLAAMSLAYYNQLTEDKTLRGSTEAMVNVLEYAKKRTQAGDLHDPSCVNFSGYQITYVDSSSYKLEFCCGVACATATKVKDYALESGNAFTSSSFSPIRFAPLTGAIASSVTATIKNTAISKCRSINVSAQGVISQDDRVSC